MPDTVSYWRRNIDFELKLPRTSSSTKNSSEAYRELGMAIAQTAVKRSRATMSRGMSP